MNFRQNRSAKSCPPGTAHVSELQPPTQHSPGIKCEDIEILAADHSIYLIQLVVAADNAKPTVQRTLVGDDHRPVTFNTSHSAARYLRDKGFAGEVTLVQRSAYDEMVGSAHAGGQNEMRLPLVIPAEDSP